jgi:hypothetical protein
MGNREKFLEPLIEHYNQRSHVEAVARSGLADDASLCFLNNRPALLEGGRVGRLEPSESLGLSSLVLSALYLLL